MPAAPQASPECSVQFDALKKIHLTIATPFVFMGLVAFYALTKKFMALECFNKALQKKKEELEAQHKQLETELAELSDGAPDRKAKEKELQDIAEELEIVRHRLIDNLVVNGVDPDTGRRMLFMKCESILVGGLMIFSTFYVKGVLTGLDCTPNKPNSPTSYLDIQPDIECACNWWDGCSDRGEKYAPIYRTSWLGLLGWIAVMGAFCGFFVGTNAGRERYGFLSQKMVRTTRSAFLLFCDVQVDSHRMMVEVFALVFSQEKRWFWWELLLLARKLLITCAGMFNTSAPGRGWYLASLVIVISLAAHSAARPFLDVWVDMTEFASLLSTL